MADPGPTDDLRFIERPTTYGLRYSRYAALLHPADTRGIAVLTHSVRLPELDADGKEQWRTEATGADGAELPAAVDTLRPRSITLNVFRKREGEDHRKHPRKATWNLAGLNCLWVDLDYYKAEEYAGATREHMAEAIMLRCYDRNLPYPSFILSSGRGLLPVWLHDRQKPSMLPVWKALQDRLHADFVDMGSDARGRACTMSFSVAGRTKRDRVTGQENMVQVVWPEYVDQIKRHDFDFLRTEMLRYSADEVRTYRKAQARERAAKAKAKAERAAKAVAAGEAHKRPALNLATLHRSVYRDLARLFEARYQGWPVDPGQRDLWLYHLSVAAAWCMAPDALVAEIDRLSPLCGLTVQRGRAMMGTVIRKARRAAAGATDAYKAGRSDPRYKSKPKSLVKELDVTVAEIRRLELRILLTDAVRREREADRSQQRRAEAGAKPRVDAQAARLALGQRALRLRAKGLTTEAIAAEAGVSISQVRKAVREAQAVAAIGGSVPKPKRGRPRKSLEAAPAEPVGKCHDSTGSIDACGQANEAPAAVVAIEAGAYTPAVRCSAPQTATDARCVPPGPAGVDVWDDDLPEFLRHLLPVPS
ncbi:MULTISPECIES: hypothetical protein [Methylobacterium]|uniref:hypothetical protein n=1 Tax=Methylobacterium TaxID=407 RepID=UPI00272DF297|nr:hypothetical protein [Methylobacterium sp.]